MLDRAACRDLPGRAVLRYPAGPIPTGAAIPMTATTFDTLAAARTLKLAGVEAEHAEAIADRLQVVAGANRDQLATKIDLSQLETRMTDRLYAAAAGIVGSNIAIAGVVVALIV